VATVHDAVKEMIRAHITLVHVFHVYASVDKPWVANALSHYTPIRYCRILLYQRHTTLLNLGIPYVSYASVHFKCLFIRTQPTRALNDTGGGYHLGALMSYPSSKKQNRSLYTCAQDV
jgi:hypothetical protein